MIPRSWDIGEMRVLRGNSAVQMNIRVGIPAMAPTGYQPALHAFALGSTRGLYWPHEDLPYSAVRRIKVAAGIAESMGSYLARSC